MFRFNNNIFELKCKSLKGGLWMAKVLSPWCKEVKHELIDRDMSISDLASMIGKTRQYTSAIVNGRIYSEPTVKEISDVLNIKETACSLTSSN